MQNLNLLEKGSLNSGLVNYEILIDSNDQSFLELDLLPSGIETVEELVRYCEDNIGVIINSLIINNRTEPLSTNLLLREASFGSKLFFGVNLKFNKNSYGK